MTWWCVLCRVVEARIVPIEESVPRVCLDCADEFMVQGQVWEPVGSPSDRLPRRRDR